MVDEKPGPRRHPIALFPMPLLLSISFDTNLDRPRPHDDWCFTSHELEYSVHTEEQPDNDEFAEFRSGMKGTTLNQILLQLCLQLLVRLLIRTVWNSMSTSLRSVLLA